MIIHEPANLLGGFDLQYLFALDVVFVVEALPVFFPIGVVVIVSGFLDMRQIGDLW